MHSTETAHTCGTGLCSTCKQAVKQGSPHQCFVQTLKVPEPSRKPRSYFFYDFEYQADPVTGEHKANLCVLHKACTRCMHVLVREEEGRDFPLCPCGRAMLVFKGADTLERFADYLFDGTHSGSIAFAHYSSGKILCFNELCKCLYMLDCSVYIQLPERNDCLE